MSDSNKTSPQDIASETTDAGKKVVLLGGTGFVGRALCERLQAEGYRLRVLTRSAKAHAGMYPSEAAGPTLELVEGDVTSFDFLCEQFAGCDVAINLIGILNERGHGGREFQALHAELPRTFARACRQSRVGRVLHMSALGAQAGSAPSRYLRSKGEGANALQVELGSKIPWTIFCPSVIFGPGDSFTNRFAKLLRFMPGFFPLACPNARFAPAFIGDVVEAFACAIDRSDTHGRRYQLCGPNEYSLREVVDYLAVISERRRRIIGLSDRLSRMQATMMEFIPGKPLSRDNYMSLQMDSTCDADNGEPGFTALGIAPESMEKIVPTYLSPSYKSRS